MASNDIIWSQVREATDIVELIGAHVALRRAGKEFKGLCPFHDDHKPSMAVVPQKQIFHCFVCGTGGDVFKFVELFHKMTKGETLRFLAQKAGIQLPELSGPRAAQAAEKRSLRETITETNARACAFFEKLLYTPDGRTGLDYFHRRGLTDETIHAFNLGMSPDKWTGLCDASMRLGISAETLITAGLAKKRSDGSPYDAFRNRVIFPILEGSGGTGKVIAFGGRVLEEKRDDQGNIVEAKYLNSPETPVFSKSETLYALDRAKQQIIKTQTAVVVEGYMDVIACHQSGVTNVVATLGTALTPEHARILKRFCTTVVLIFDSDDAGFRAADRAMQTLVHIPIDVKIASVADGKDPCDFCMSHGGEAFQKIVDSATDMLTYQWNRLQKQFSAHTGLSARAEAAREFMRFVASGLETAGKSGGGIDPIRRGMLLNKLSTMVGLPVSEVTQTLRQLAAAPGGGANAPRPSDETPAPARPTFNAAKLTGLATAEAWVLGSLLADPKLYDKVREELSLTLFAPDCLQPLASALLEYFESATDLSTCTLADFTSTLADPHLSNQAIQLETLSVDFANPSNFSPEIERVVRSQQSDMGRSLERRLIDSLKELLTRRPADASPSEAPLSDDESVARTLAQAQARKLQGGNNRLLGPPPR